MKARKPKTKPGLPDLKSPVGSFLETALAQRAAAEGGFPNLTGAITSAYLANLVEASSFKKKQIITRVKLAKLAQGDRSVRLSIEELKALHFYLEPFGLGLDRKPLFGSSTVLQSLAASRSATFLLGSNMSHEGGNIPLFDMLAMVEIQRSLNRLTNPLHLDVFDVHGKTPHAGDPPRPWTRVFGRYGPSAICIGSSRANQATERALCEIFGLGRGQTPWARMPFYFVWEHGRSINQQQSRLARDRSHEPGKHPELAQHLKDGRGWGLVVGDRAFCSEHVTKTVGVGLELKESVLSHAVIAAQRQREGQIWIVVAGLNGTGTYLAAALLPSMRGTLPRREDKCPQAVLWGVVEGRVDTGAMSEKGRLPVPSETRFVVEPSLWDPQNKRPVT